MKRMIKYTINHIPRPVIQRVAHHITRIVAIFHLGNKVECPICGHHYRRFLPYGYTVVRKNALCPHCLSLERHRLLWLYLKEKTALFDMPTLSLLHIAPERCFMDKLEHLLGNNYITADLESPLAKVQADIRCLPFKDACFDVVFCNHVLEHIDNDRKAIKEMYRVMRRGGWGIMLSPVNYRLETTREAPIGSSPEERYSLFGQADHMREYGTDYADRLREGGFEVEEIPFAETLSAKQHQRYCINDEIVYVVHKQ